MNKRDIIYLKKDPNTRVYRKKGEPGVVYKEYIVAKSRNSLYESREDLQRHRNKLLAIKRYKNWPKFVIKPYKIYDIKRSSFIAVLPYIAGDSLGSYLRNNTLDLHFCADFISKLEKNIMSKQNFVFPDIANVGNIILFPSEEETIDFKVIDPDDIQFSKYGYDKVAESIGLKLDDDCLARGISKCLSSNSKVNKQLDIRSMFSLFYLMMNSHESFYPINYEKSTKSYLRSLRTVNIPKDSSLYIKSLITISDDEPNVPIGDSLFELVDAGYNFEVYGINKWGNQYRLKKKRTYY